ncbi:MAG: type II toxin-antitoxin system VapC family toxin [Chloroflexi bacterium]|nr:type II toxin-antitoxin system VapC family toxin [Chloroflexota bacterium]
MNVVDSSGWLEYFNGGKRSEFFAAAIEDTDNLLVPVICVYEVFKRLLSTEGLAVAETRIADLMKGQVVELSQSLALSAAALSVEHKLPMADSMILAAAYQYGAILWTQDEHFKAIEGVRYIAGN